MRTQLDVPDLLVILGEIDFNKILEEHDDRVMTEVYKFLYEPLIYVMTPKRVMTLKKNVVDILQILYRAEKPMTSCGVLIELEKVTPLIPRSRHLYQIELGGGAIGTINILDILKKHGIVERDQRGLYSIPRNISKNYHTTQ